MNEFGLSVEFVNEADENEASVRSCMMERNEELRRAIAGQRECSLAGRRR